MKIYVIYLGEDGQTHGQYFDRLKSTIMQNAYFVGENGTGFDAEHVMIPTKGITLIRPATNEEMETI